jgi:hypothetical protein
MHVIVMTAGCIGKCQLAIHHLLAIGYGCKIISNLITGYDALSTYLFSIISTFIQSKSKNLLQACWCQIKSRAWRILAIALIVIARLATEPIHVKDHLGEAAHLSLARIVLVLMLFDSVKLLIITIAIIILI